MKLLIIEDEPKIAEAIATGLRQERMNVEVAHDGPHGYQMALHETYDAIILDRMLPGGMDGLEICRELRTQGCDTPILLLSAKGQTGDKVAGLNAGADDYLAKPFAFDELLARIRALIRRPPRVTQATLSVDTLSLDTVTFEATRAGRSIHLSRTEYDLLHYLLRNLDRVVNKDQIIRDVWDFDADILPNTVEAYIKYLRQKIDQPFPDERPLVETVRGFGYVIRSRREGEG